MKQGQKGNKERSERMNKRHVHSSLVLLGPAESTHLWTSTPSVWTPRRGPESVCTPLGLGSQRPLWTPTLALYADARPRGEAWEVKTGAGDSGLPPTRKNLRMAIHGGHGGAPACGARADGMACVFVYLRYGFTLVFFFTK